MQTRPGRVAGARLPISSPQLPVGRSSPREAARRAAWVAASIQISSSGFGSDPDTSASSRAQQSKEGRPREESETDRCPPPSDEDSLSLPDGPDASPRSLACSRAELERPQIQRGGEDPPRDVPLFQPDELANLLRNVLISRSPSDHTRRKLPASKPSRIQLRQDSRPQNDDYYDGDHDDDDDSERDRRPSKRSKTADANTIANASSFSSLGLKKPPPPPPPPPPLPLPATQRVGLPRRGSQHDGLPHLGPGAATTWPRFGHSQ